MAGGMEVDSLAILSVASGGKKGRQPSRKGKKAWRRNVDITEVEGALDNARTEERLVGSRLVDLPNDALFHVDKAGDQQVAAKLAPARKRLRIDEILTPASAIPGVRSRATARGTVDPVDKKSKKREASKTWTELVERKRRRLENASASGQVTQRKPAKAVSKGVWTVEELPKEDLPQTYVDYVLPSLPQPLVRPKTLSMPPHAQQVPTTSPHPGISYNPTFTDHQDALRAAVADEEEKERKRKELEEKTRFGPRTEGYEDEVDVDDGEEDGGEGDDEKTEGEDGAGVARTVSNKRKTTAERNREKRRKEQERLYEKQRQQKKLQKSLNNLPVLLKSISQIPPPTPTAPKRAPRLGPVRYHPPPHTVQLTEDLPERLRQLKPEGNLVADAMEAVYGKGVLEKRNRGAARKVKVKEFETHAYKRFQ